MDQLDLALSTYKKLLNRNYQYVLSNGVYFDFFFTPGNLKHFLGIHKLNDIKLPDKSSTLFSKLNNGSIGLNTLKSSKQFHKIKERIELFPYIEDLLGSTSTYNFDKSKVVYCNFNSNYLFYNKYNNIGLYFGIAHDDIKSYYYPETFFVRLSDIEYYIKNQEQLDISKVYITPKYNYSTHYPDDILKCLDLACNSIGYYPTYNDILTNIEIINTSVEVIGQQRYMLQSKENQYSKVEKYIKSRDEASAALEEVKGNSAEHKELYNDLSGRFSKMNKLFSLSGFQSVEEFKDAYSKFQEDKDVSILELDKQHNNFTQNLKILYDTKNSLESYLHQEIIKFHVKDYPGASKWTLKDTNLIHNLNESYSKALTLEEIKQLEKTDPVRSVLELFKDNSHDKEIEIER